MNTYIFEHVLLIVIASILVMKSLNAKTIPPTLMAPSSDNLSRMADVPTVNYNSSPNPQYTGGYNKMYDNKPPINQLPLAQQSLPASQQILLPITQSQLPPPPLQTPIQQYPPRQQYLPKEQRPHTNNYVSDQERPGQGPPAAVPNNSYHPNQQQPINGNENQNYSPLQPLPPNSPPNSAPNAYDSNYKHFKYLIYFC